MAKISHRLKKSVSKKIPKIKRRMKKRKYKAKLKEKIVEIKQKKVLKEKKRVIFHRPKFPKISKFFKFRLKPTLPFLKKRKKHIELRRLPKKLTREILASDIMSRNVITVSPSDTLNYVVKLFAEKDISGAPVLRGNKVIGVISESDILKIIGTKDLLSIDTVGLKRLGEIKTEEVMNRNLIFAFEHSKLSDITDLMNKYDITRIPVLNEKRQLTGIITRSDITRGISKELLFKLIKKKPGEIEKLRPKIDTDIDEVLKIVERRGTISISEIKEKLMLPEEKIEEWGKILESHNLLEVVYPPFGKPELRKKIK